ncbi:HYExAFE family protein [Planctomycetota bacterium]
MEESYPNHYERAFENWLIDNGINYAVVDEHKRSMLGKSDIKSFDFLLYPDDDRVIIVEVKGRKFKGTTLSKLMGFECWVTTEDVEGLTMWQQAFGKDHQAIFVFAYKIENIDVDFEGREIFEYDENRYLFLCINLEDYCRFMKSRSPKWKTVTLNADKFRQTARQLSDLFR